MTMTDEKLDIITSIDRETLRRQFEPACGEGFIYKSDDSYGDEDVTFTQVNYVHKMNDAVMVMVIMAEPIPYVGTDDDE